jgi:hypothetical protein
MFNFYKFFKASYKAKYCSKGTTSAFMVRGRQGVLSSLGIKEAKKDARVFRSPYSCTRGPAA